MTIYTKQQVDKLLNQYNDKCGNIYTITGCLLDNYICTAIGYKSAIIKEKYLNEWSSAYTITMYNRLPKKYQQVINLLEDDYNKAEKLFWK